MKISDIMRAQGAFSKDIKQRFQQKQIKINGEVVEDIDIQVHQIFDGADWFFHFFSKLTPKEKNICRLMVNICESVDNLFAGEFTLNDIPFETILPSLTSFKGHLFLRTSKKDIFVIELKRNITINSDDTSTWD